MTTAKRILLMASIVAASASFDAASASIWKRTPKPPAEAAAAAAGSTLSAVLVDGTRVVLRTSGSPAYTSYSPSPDVFVVDLTSTAKAADVAVPATLPAGVASISAEDAVEMGNRLTRVTFRLQAPGTPQASASGNDVVVTVPQMAGLDPKPAAGEQPAPAVVAAVPVEAPHVEPVAEPAHPAVSEPVATAEPLPAATPLPAPVSANKATALRRIEATGSGAAMEVRLDANGAVDFNAFRLDKPARIVLDLNGVTDKLPKNTINVGDAIVKRVRVSQFKSAPQAVTRVVLDLGEKSDYQIVRDGDRLRIVFGAGAQVDVAQALQPARGGLESRPPRSPEPPPQPRPAEVKPARSGDVTAQVPVMAENATTWRMPETASRGAKPVINAPVNQEPPNTIRRSRPATSPAPVPMTPVPENVFTDTNAADQAVPGTLPPPGGRTLSEGQRVFTGEPISLNLKDADIKDVLRTFAQLTGLNIAVDPQVAGTVTVDFVDVPWDQALDIILRQNGLTFVVDGNVMRVGTIERLAAETAATRRLQEEERLNVPLQTISFALSYARATEVAVLLREIASPRARIIVDQRTNQLIISEIPQYLQTMRKLIDTVDVPTKQVVIEARIVETTKNFAQQYGFNWGFNGVFDPALGNGTGLVFPNRVGFTGGPFVFTGGAPPVLGLTLTDVLGSFNLDLALHAFEAEGLVKVISAPKVQTSDNTPAEIQSGFQIPYQTRVNFTTTVAYVDATLRLSVTPQITQAGTVIMDIQVQKTEPATGLAIEGGAGTPLSTRQARTRLMVRDGGTSVIGGIYQTKENNSQTRLPFVHQIPIIGALFRTHNISSTHDELLIFITPRIVRGS